MNKSIYSAIAALLIPAAIQAQNATTWTGADNASISSAASWSNGLPTSGNATGTIPVSTSNINWNAPTLTNYEVIQNGGNLTAAVGRTFTGGNWTLNQGSMVMSNSTATGYIRTGSNHTLTVNGGSLTSAGSMTIGNTGNATFVMTGGSVTSGATFVVNAGSTFTMSGGVLTVSGNNTFGGAGQFNINGGNINIGANLNPTPGFLMTLGNGSAGSINAVAFGGTVANQKFDWSSGTQMTMTLSGASSNWSQTLWDANTLYYNSQNKLALGNMTWTTATTDLGDGSRFAYDSNTKTLSLAVPEPSTWVLAAVALILGIALHRNFNRNITRK